MADKIGVDVTGKSKYEVAEHMARHILYAIEKNSAPTRSQFLKAVEESIYVLNGGPAPS